jgi:hypothetical protein
MAYHELSARLRLVAVAPKTFAGRSLVGSYQQFEQNFPYRWLKDHDETRYQLKQFSF